MVDQAFSNYECNTTTSNFCHPVLGQGKTGPSSSLVSLPASHLMSGGVTGWGKTDEDRRTAVIEENIHRVEEYLTQNKKISLREATVDLDLCYVTILNISGNL